MPPQPPTHPPTPLQPAPPVQVIPAPPAFPVPAQVKPARALRGWLWPVLIFCAIGLTIYSVRVAAVTGSSMEPALHEGSRIVIDLLTPRFVGIGRGDVIVFRNPK